MKYFFSLTNILKILLLIFIIDVSFILLATVFMLFGFTMTFLQNAWTWSLINKIMYISFGLFQIISSASILFTKEGTFITKAGIIHLKGKPAQIFAGILFLFGIILVYVGLQF